MNDAGEDRDTMGYEKCIARHSQKHFDVRTREKDTTSVSLPRKEKDR